MAKGVHGGDGGTSGAEREREDGNHGLRYFESASAKELQDDMDARGDDREEEFSEDDDDVFSSDDDDDEVEEANA